MEVETLRDLRTDVEILNGMIVYTENITALSIFNHEILRHGSKGGYELKKLYLDSILIMGKRKRKENYPSSFYSSTHYQFCNFFKKTSVMNDKEVPWRSLHVYIIN